MTKDKIKNKRSLFAKTVLLFSLMWGALAYGKTQEPALGTGLQDTLSRIPEKQLRQELIWAKQDRLLKRWGPGGPEKRVSAETWEWLKAMHGRVLHGPDRPAVTMRQVQIKATQHRVLRTEDHRKTHFLPEQERYFIDPETGHFVQEKDFIGRKTGPLVISQSTQVVGEDQGHNPPSDSGVDVNNLPSDSGVDVNNLPSTGRHSSELPQDRQSVPTTPAFKWEVVVPKEKPHQPGEKPAPESKEPPNQQRDPAETTSPPTPQPPEGMASVDHCDVPAGVDILHIPVQSWTDSDWFTKTRQELLNKVEDKALDAFDFIQGKVTQLINGEKQAEWEGEDDISSSVVSEIVEKRAYAQFMLVQIIRQNPQSAVFHEWTTQLYDNRRLYYFKYAIEVADGVRQPEQVKDNSTMEHLFQLVNSQFPSGLPDSYDSLTKGQKETLSIVGGVYTLFFLYDLPVIFPALTDQDYQTIFDKAGIHKLEFERCGYNSIAPVCSDVVSAVHKNFQLSNLKAIGFFRKVQSFLALFSSRFDELPTSMAQELPKSYGEDDFPADQKPHVILAYDNYSRSSDPGHDETADKGEAFNILSSYWTPSDHFYSLPEECLSLPGKMEP